MNKFCVSGGAVLLACVLGGPLGCEKKPEPASNAPAKPAPKGDGHDHDHDHDHDHKGGDDHGHGAAVALGEQSIGGFTVKAGREGDVVAGKDAAFDVDITGGTAKVVAVRFWVGAEDAKGSIKAKAELESGSTWHAHAEIPAELPAGSKLWVEIEAEGGQKSVGGFDLKK